MALAPITDAELAAGKPITQSLMTRLRDAAYAGGGGGAGLGGNVSSTDGAYTVPENIRSIGILMRARNGEPGEDDDGDKGSGHRGGAAGRGGELYGVFDVTPGDIVTMQFDVNVSVDVNTAGRPANRLAINVVVGSTALQVIQGGNGADATGLGDGADGQAGGATPGYQTGASVGITPQPNTVLIRE